MDTEDDLRFDRGDETPGRLKGQFSRLVGMTAAQTRRVAGDALRSVGAHKDHFVVLAALAELGPASQSTLSDRTRVYRSDLVAVLNELTDGGWVRRSPDPADKRRNVVSITAAGARRLDELDAILREVNDRVLAPLSADDRARLFRFLEQVNAHLAAEADVS